MDWMQIFALITGAIYIVLEIRQKNFMWVVGIITSLASMYVFFRQGLYASFGLNTYYFITSVIGLYHWTRMRTNYQQYSSGDEDVILITPLTSKVLAVSAFVAVAGTLALSFSMQYFCELGLLAENPMSLLDASVAVLSAVATWWLVKCHIQHWLLWIVADTLSVILCLTQQMWWMALLYFCYVASAVFGLYYWKKKAC